MRTTVTLDDDVAARLHETARERRVSFKVALNEAVRAGLGTAGVAKPYRVPTRPMGARPEVDLDQALALAAQLEDAETLRKLDRGK
ncbi:MAG: CopG family transcriptional regulator [Conexibacter sp.]